jgi:transposase-like protein
MPSNCPYCPSKENPRPSAARAGRFRRKSDGRWIQRYRCLDCRRGFSTASAHPCFNQNKRQVNFALWELFCSGVSQRRAARLLHLSRTTVVRKLLFLSSRAQAELSQINSQAKPCTVIEFDDLETFEHTKYKPISVTLAVESKTRRILGFTVSRMPAKGPLAKLALKRYGPRPDERRKGRNELFRQISPFVSPDAVIKSDENPHYRRPVQRHFPHAVHERFPGQRGSIVGQGELKKVRFDPLFSLNHTCAMLRANINRLFRRTWCTTKKPERLAAHIALYAVYHNQNLKSA